MGNMTDLLTIYYTYTLNKKNILNYTNNLSDLKYINFNLFQSW